MPDVQRVVCCQYEMSFEQPVLRPAAAVQPDFMASSPLELALGQPDSRVDDDGEVRSVAFRGGRYRASASEAWTHIRLVTVTDEAIAVSVEAATDAARAIADALLAGLGWETGGREESCRESYSTELRVKLSVDPTGLVPDVHRVISDVLKPIYKRWGCKLAVHPTTVALHALGLPDVAAGADDLHVWARRVRQDRLQLGFATAADHEARVYTISTPLPYDETLQLAEAIEKAFS